MLFLILLVQAVFSQSQAILKVPLCSRMKHQHRRLFYFSQNGQTDIGRINYFTFDQNGSSTGATPTVVDICHDIKYLYINFTNTDSDIISTLKGCNSPLYTEDAVEFFIATPDSYPKDYYQFEVSPNGQLFFADINNVNLSCSKLNTQYKECQTVQYGASRTSSGWNAWLKLDLQIIGRQKYYGTFYGNFYRIDKNQGKATEYLCWQSTIADPPCFHKPRYFGIIQLI